MYIQDLNIDVFLAYRIGSLEKPRNIQLQTTIYGHEMQRSINV